MRGTFIIGTNSCRVIENEKDIAGTVKVSKLLSFSKYKISIDEHIFSNSYQIQKE